MKILLICIFLMSISYSNSENRDSSYQLMKIHELELDLNTQITKAEQIEIRLKEFNEERKRELDKLEEDLESKMGMYVSAIVILSALIAFIFNFFGKKSIKNKITELISETAQIYAKQQTDITIDEKLTNEFIRNIIEDKGKAELAKIFKEFQKRFDDSMTDFEKKKTEILEVAVGDSSSKVFKTSDNKSDRTDEYEELFNEILNENNSIIKVKKYKELLEIFPDNDIILNNIGATYMSLEDWDQALIYLNKSIELNGINGLAKANKSRIFYELNQYLIALKIANEAIEDDNSIILAYSVKAKILLSMGKLDEAIKSYEELFLANPKNPNSYFDRGYFYDSINEFDKSLDDYLKAEELGYRGKANLFNNIAVVYRRKKMFDKALQYIEKGIKVDSEYENLYGTLALIYADLNNNEEFYKNLTIALDKGCKAWEYLDDSGFDNYRNSDRFNNLINKYKFKI